MKKNKHHKEESPSLTRNRHLEQTTRHFTMNFFPARARGPRPPSRATCCGKPLSEAPEASLEMLIQLESTEALPERPFPTRVSGPVAPAAAPKPLSLPSPHDWSPAPPRVSPSVSSSSGASAPSGQHVTWAQTPPGSSPCTVCPFAQFRQGESGLGERKEPADDDRMFFFLFP